MNPKRLILLDASSLNNSGCLRRYVLNNILGYRSSQPDDISPVYGSAFHVFKEVLKRYKNDQLAVMCGQKYLQITPFSVGKGKEWMNLGHLTDTMLGYLEKFGPNGERDNFITLLDSSGNPLVEQTVSIPYYQDDYCEVLLQGTIDDVGKILNGCFCIKDIKTTSSWNHKEFFQGFELGHQLMFYLLIVKWLAKYKPDSIWNEMIHSRVGCAIDAVFLMKDKPTEFERSPIMFYDEQKMFEFELLINAFIRKLSHYVSQADLVPIPLREGILNQTCQGRFPGKKCEYFGMCSAVDSVVGGHILRNNFVRKEYNPLSFRSIPPEIQQLIDKFQGIKTT